MRFDHRQILRQRKLLGWTQEDLAGRSGVSQEIISRVERGLNQSAKTFKQLAKPLRLRMEDLLIEDAPEPVGARRVS